ncbi:MAG: PKD domain-containing protein [Bacteroidales bacterium]|nr:PKD domain-containing protein [Bacteroidales bacterium]
MKRIISIIFAAILLLPVSCKKETVEVFASFDVNRDVYGPMEPVLVTNTTTVNNSVIAICKWEWAGNVSYDFEPEGIKFEEEGEYPIKLTVTANDGAVKGEYTKTIVVADNNIKPVADFTWSPETARAGEAITFTDRSTDEDGTITAWEWNIGGSVSTEQNPVITIIASGEVKVSLTVTDDRLGRDTKTATIMVEKGKYTIDLDWKKTYGETGHMTRYTSPAMSPDGQTIYVTSTDCKLYAYGIDGSQKWAYDYGSKHGVKYTTSLGGNDARVVTPSVDADGTIFFAGGYNEPNADGQTATIFALNSNGSLKWAQGDGNKTDFGMFSPVIMDNAIATAQTNGGALTNDQGCVLLNKATGEKIIDVFARQGSQGGMAAWGEMLFCNAGGTAMGTQVIFPDLSYVPKANEAYCPGAGHAARSCQPAVSKEGILYTFYPRNESDPTKGGILYSFDPNTFVSAPTSAAESVWTVNIAGELSSDKLGSATAVCGTGGHGMVLSADGTIYVTTRTSLTAVSKAGKILWTHTPEGRIDCVPAVDNAGFVYYCDRSGNIVKLSADGQEATRLKLAAEFSSSITISNDGKLYVVGMENNAPTLFCLTTNDITGPADNWSQLGCNPSKTARMNAAN